MNEMIREYELVSDSGMKLKFLNYAGAVTSLKVLKSNTEHEVIVGPGKPENFLLDKSSFGALVGRFANRIKDGQFRLDGNDYQLEKTIKGITCTVDLRVYINLIWTLKFFHQAMHDFLMF